MGVIKHPDFPPAAARRCYHPRKGRTYLFRVRAAEIHGCSCDDVEALMSGMPDATAEAYPRLYGQTASQLEAPCSTCEVNNPCNMTPPRWTREALSC